MKDTTRLLAMLSGVGLCLLGVAATLAYPARPEFVDEPARLAAFYDANSGALLGANSLYLLGGALIIVFAGALGSLLARAEGRDGHLSGMVFGGIVVGAALALAGTALDTAAALRVDEQGSIAPDTAAALADGHGVLFGLAAPVAFGVAVLATAALALRTAVLPRWLAGLSVVLGIALLVPPIAYIAAITFTFWCLVTGIVLYLRPRRTQTDGLIPRESPARRSVSMVVICVALFAAMAGTAAGVAPANPGRSSADRELQQAKAATADFHSPRQAQAAGYVAPPPGACVASPLGGMGYHFENPALMQDGVLDLRRPEILLYEREADGRLRLTGVEYYMEADGTQSAPALFGQTFKGPMPAHHPNMEEHYDLHVWLWKDNPRGRFEDWNADVSCP